MHNRETFSIEDKPYRKQRTVGPFFLAVRTSASFWILCAVPLEIAIRQVVQKNRISKIEQVFLTRPQMFFKSNAMIEQVIARAIVNLFPVESKFRLPDLGELGFVAISIFYAFTRLLSENISKSNLFPEKQSLSHLRYVLILEPLCLAFPLLMDAV